LCFYRIVRLRFWKHETTTVGPPQPATLSIDLLEMARQFHIDPRAFLVESAEGDRAGLPELATDAGTKQTDALAKRAFRRATST
jgi:hypothetical protein